MDEKQQSSAAAAGKQVQAIIEAAEATAREIEEGARTRAEAIREQAEREAAEHVTRARQMVELLAGGAEQLQAEIDDVVVRVDGLKAAIDAVRVDLLAAEEDVTQSHASAAAPVGPIHPEPQPEPEPEPEPDPEPDSEPEPAMAAAPVEPSAPATPPDEADRSGPAATASRAPEGVRLIALNMALSGTPRDETARYLRENFEVEEPDSLLDEVYAKAGS